MKQKYDVHLLAAAFPALGASELDELVDDIRRNGVREPIVLYEGKILDGRNRAKAAAIAGIELPTVLFDPKTAGCSPAEFVISMNLVRRHLTPSQKSAIAHEFMERVQHDVDGAKMQRRPVEEWEDITASIHHAPPPPPPPSSQHHLKGRQRTLVAEKFGVSEGLIDAARRVKARSPELHEEVKAGRISVQEALEKAERGTKKFHAALGKIEKILGPRAMEAVREKKTKDVLMFADLTDDQMRNLWPLIKAGESVANTIKYKDSMLTPAHTIRELIAAATVSGGSITVGEFIISVAHGKKSAKRQKEDLHAHHT